MKDNYLNFEDVVKTAREHYNNVADMVNYSSESQDYHFESSRKFLEHFLFLLYDNQENDFLSLGISIRLHYSILGIFYESLMKDCLLKENWEGYLSAYTLNKKNQSFEYAKQQLLKSLGLKINIKQKKRFSDIFDFIQVQRNNFIHSTLRGYDDCATEKEILQSILVLDKLYHLNFSAATRSCVKNRIDMHLPWSGMDFEDVNLLELLD